MVPVDRSSLRNLVQYDYDSWEIRELRFFLFFSMTQQPNHKLIDPSETQACIASGSPRGSLGSWKLGRRKGTSGNSILEPPRQAELFQTYRGTRKKKKKKIESSNYELYHYDLRRLHD
jgi:hypothetical protein